MIINGKEVNFVSSITISQMLDKLELSEDKVVVEVNLEIVPKSEYGNKFLDEDDRVEIISLVGGG